MLRIARLPGRLPLNAIPCSNISSVRSYSVALQASAHRRAPRIAGAPARSLWGSAAAAPAPAPVSSTPPVPAAVSSETTSIDEAVSTTTSAPETTTWTDALTSAPTLDAPIDPSVLTTLEPATLSALGLISWTPAGLVRASLELLHTTTHLPWFWTIAGGTLLWRALLVPLNIRTTRNSARMIVHGPALQAASEEFKAAVATTQDPAARAAAMHKMMAVYAQAGVNPRTMMLAPLVQLPVVLGLFVGVKGLCEYAPAIPALTASGVALLPDLTIPTYIADPYLILPLLSVVGMNLQMRLAVREVDPAKPAAPHVFNALRVLAPVGAVFMSWLPAGVMVSMLTTVGSTLLTTAALQIPRIRATCGIPPLPKEPPRLPKIMESRRALQEYLREGRAKALEEAIRREKERAGKQ